VGCQKLGSRTAANARSIASKAPGPTRSPSTPPSTPAGSTKPRSTSQSSSAKVVTPNNFADLETLEHHLLAFGRRYEQIAAPFQSKFTRTDHHQLLAKAAAPQPTSLAA
jgi:hypothetical protein